MTFEEWEQAAPEVLKRDRTWRMRVYRLATYLTEKSRPDAERAFAHALTRKSAAQMYDAVGSIRCNLVEGYSRSSGRDRVRIFEYALGSAREAREWYFHIGGRLSADVLTARSELLDEVIQMLLGIIPRERDRIIRKKRKKP